ncbi:MAG: toprim domain-containing protein [Thiohalocapsa sp.]|nr:toprim domain-containing protein [Thiohalocapsa sp.]
MHAIESADIRQAVRRTGWLAVLEALVPEALGPALRRPGRHVPCPVHGKARKNGRGDGFRLFPDADRTGGGICATCGAYPDGLALLQWLFGWSFPEALTQVGAVLGLTGAPARPLVPAFARTGTHRPHPMQAQKARHNLRRTWCESLPPSHPDAEPLCRYLAGRGLDAAVLNPRVVRFHPALAYWSRDAEDRPICLGRFPAMLALVSDANGRPVTLHRTYLQPDGRGKASVRSPKKLMAHPGTDALTGGAIRLFRAGASRHVALGVAEGIETALAVHAMTGMPVWACVSATLLKSFRPPVEIERIMIWADNDRSGAGQRAASALGERLGGSLDVHILLPPAPVPVNARGVDWADCWLMRQSGSAALSGA